MCIRSVFATSSAINPLLKTQFQLQRILNYLDVEPDKNLVTQTHCSNRSEVVSVFVVKPDISAPSSSRAKDSPLQYICTGEGNTLLSSPSLPWGDIRLFRRVEFGVSEQSQEPMTQQHIVGTNRHPKCAL